MILRQLSLTPPLRQLWGLFSSSLLVNFWPDAKKNNATQH
jgi:hypothetical protein